MGNSIIDLIIRIKNGYMSHKDIIASPYSSFKEALLKKMKRLNYIKDFSVSDEKIKTITIELLYKDNSPIINDIKIMSKPGKRQYVSYKQLKPVVNNFGYSILSTPKGIMTNKEAQKEKLGGELLFEIW